MPIIMTTCAAMEAETTQEQSRKKRRNKPSKRDNNSSARFYRELRALLQEQKMPMPLLPATLLSQLHREGQQSTSIPAAGVAGGEQLNKLSGVTL